MHRRRVVNLCLLGLVLALGALALWPPAGGDDQRARLTPLAPDAVRALRVEYPRDDSRPALTLERRPDGWHLTRPIARGARDGRVVTALRVLGSRGRSCYALEGRDPAAFGLSPPRLLLHSGDTSLAFGDRHADGRRYVRAGARLCLVDDTSYPLLASGVDGLAAPTLLPGAAAPLRIETPAFAAAREHPGADWRALRGGDADVEALRAWAAAWRAARAGAFVLAPPAANHGRVRIEASDGAVHEWRIARPAPDLLLVPTGADYGMIIADAAAANLLLPGAPAPER